MVWSIDTDDFKADCPTESDIFFDFYNSLKEIRRNPYFKEVLPEIDIRSGIKYHIKRSINCVYLLK